MFFVVAILVLLLKSGEISIKIQDGFFLFFASVMLTQTRPL